jgi:GGDEF domain-containing protein
MASSSPVIVVSSEATEAHDVLARTGTYPVREMRADQFKAIARALPAAVVLATPDPDHEIARTIADALVTPDGAIVPILRVKERGTMAGPHALPIDAESVAPRLVPRLRAALRVRALHAAVLRRCESLGTEGVPELPAYDPIEDATVLVAGRGRGYPALTLAVGERMGLIGALSLDRAREYLEARDIDGLVIGDGFNRAMVEDFMEELGADPRWRDLPVIVPRDIACGLDPERMPNVDQVSGAPEEIAAHIHPFARMHAFMARLKRMAVSLDEKGVRAPETGLLTQSAFMGELQRHTSSAGERGASLSLARLSLVSAANRRASVDAARITSRLLRASDIACRDEDGTILIAFTETDLVTAHVVARRIASVLKHTALTPGGDPAPLGPTVSLAALRARDTVETLVARTSDRLVAAD